MVSSMTHNPRPFRIGDRILIMDSITANTIAALPGKPGYWLVELDDGEERVVSERFMTHTLRVVS